jgi:PDGLE domain
MKPETKLWILLGIMMILTPLGLLAAGTAWGEWGMDELQDALGYVPQGFQHLADLWNAPMADYSLPGWDENPVKASIAYILSAVVGGGLIVAVAFGLGKALSSKEGG